LLPRLTLDELAGDSMIVAFAEDHVDLGDTALDPRLLVLGVVVLGVLGDVPNSLASLMRSPTSRRRTVSR
jgi:hypothetical protein